MKYFPQIRRGVEKINTFVAVFGMVLVIPLMLLTTADVLGRGFFNKPFPGTFELSEFMLAVVILFGAAYTQKEKGHVSVDFITSRFGLRTQKVFQVITLGLSLSIITIVVWQGFILGIEATEVTDQLRIPTGPFKFLVGIGGALLWLQLLFDLIDSVKELVRKTS